MTAVGQLLDAFDANLGPLRVLGASGQLGYGIPEASFRRGLARQPHFIGCDMGSIDPGPHYLGSGTMAAPAMMVERDLELVLKAVQEHGLPLVIGSAGTAGARPHLEATMDIVRRIVRRLGTSLKVATITSDVAPERLIAPMQAGNLHPLGPIAMPSAEQILACANVVAQCGTDTMIRALQTRPDVVIAGRACDTAIFAAIPRMLGYDAGLALHMAKIIECSSLCCTPAGRDAILASLDRDGFELESMNPLLRATPASVAAHALYEQSDPNEVIEPEGTLLLEDARYEAIDERRTRVSGARLSSAPQHTWKIEGAARVGCRVVLIAGAADPGFINNLPQALATVTSRVRELVPGLWSAYPRVYGQGAIRPLACGVSIPAEVGLVIEFIADDADLALAAAGVFKQNLLHFGFPGRLSTAGNIAFPFTPSEILAQPAYRFVLYHVLHGAREDELFTVNCGNV